MSLGSGIRSKPIPDPGVKKAPDPDPQHCFLPIPDPGSKGQKGTGSPWLGREIKLNPGGGWLIMKGMMVAKQRGRWLGREMGC
jgi:hypothetical protein